ncbi:hypothetical protein P0F65_14970 [Sphingomonas sp. I4]
MTYDAALSDHARLKVDGWARYVGVSRLGLGPELGRSRATSSTAASPLAWGGIASASPSASRT